MRKFESISSKNTMNGMPSLAFPGRRGWKKRHRDRRFNREDMIDPAILRPSLLDVKIKIERSDAEAAKDVLTGLPLVSGSSLRQQMALIRCCFGLSARGSLIRSVDGVSGRRVLNLYGLPGY